MSIEGIPVIENTKSGAVVKGSSCELAHFFNELAASGHVKRMGQRQGIEERELKALLIERSAW